MELFLIVVVTSWPTRLVRVFLRKLWSSIKDLKTPFLFELEHEIVLYAMPGHQASSGGKGKVLWFFSSCIGIVGYILT